MLSSLHAVFCFCDAWVCAYCPAQLQVGSIFGVWPGRGFVGRGAREQVAAAYAVYGPKTLLVLARPVGTGEAAAAGGRRHVVQEFVLLPWGAWQLSR